MAKHQQQPEEMRKRINYLMAKLSDRDTESMAFAELNSICRNLNSDFLPNFVSIVGDTHPSDKTSLRSHSLRLIALLADSHPPATLHPHLPRILSTVLRRIRDPESAVRTALVAAVRSLAAVAAPSGTLVTSLLRPLADTLFLEQEVHSQSASAFSLSAVLDEPNAANAADLPGYLLCLVPRLVKLVRSLAFKAKPALLTLLGSVAGAGGASDGATLQALVPCLVKFLGSDEWSSRKAAAEALIRLAATERDRLSGFKLSCIASFGARRYDKVKIVRDSMNRMLEAWSKIPDRDLDLPQPEPHPPLSSSQEETGIDWKCPATSVNGSSYLQSSTSSIAINTRQSTSRSLSSTPNITGKKIVGRKAGLKQNSAFSRRKGQGKNSDWGIEIIVPDASSYTIVCEDKIAEGKGKCEKNGEQGRDEDNDLSLLEARKVFFEMNSEEKMGGLKSRSQIVLFHENMSSEVTNEADCAVDEFFGIQKDCDLSLIQKHLVKIENQQSTLLDLIQKLIGNSQNGINSLEMRVHSLEMALDGISQDLDMPYGRLSNSDPAAKTCCKFPGTEFLSSKLWRRTEDKYASRFLTDSHVYRNRDVHDVFKSSLSLSALWNKQKFRPCGRFENAIAEFNPCSRGIVQLATPSLHESATFDARIKHLQDG